MAAFLKEHDTEEGNAPLSTLALGSTMPSLAIFY